MEGVINKHFNLVRNICALLALALLLLILFPVYIKEDSASAVTGTATSANTSLSLTTNHDNAVVTITPNSANGTFAMSSAAGEAQFGVTTNNFTGYELSIVADDDNGNLVNIDNGITHTISSIPSSITKSSFDTTTYNNKWGYKPSKYLGPNSTIVTNTGDSALFLPSPTTTGTILDHTTVANSSANNYSIALGVRADYNTYAGTYSKTFTLVATANPTTYTINYNKNTTDTVTNMPTAQSSATSETSITLASNTPGRASYLFLGWCNVQPTTTNYVDSCSGTIYQPSNAYGLDQTTANTTTLYAMWKINNFTQTTQVRYENVDGTWGSYNTVDTQQVAYGSSYSWSTSQIPGFNNITYQSASVSSYTVTGEKTNQVSIYRNTFTCAKQYRLENADGTWGGYTSDGSETLRYGATCSYSKTVTDYKGSASGANNSAASTSATITSGTTLSLNLYRNTFALTVVAGNNISSVSGSGMYRWDASIAVTATKPQDSSCATYSNPSWTRTAGSFNTTIGASVTFTMPKSDATVTASSTQTNKYQTITLVKNNGGTGFYFDGNSSVNTSSSVSLSCGTHTISGRYANGYEFSSWSGDSGVSVASASSASTSITVSGAGTLTQNGKASGVTFAQAFANAGKSTSGGYYLMQDMTASICQNAKLGDSITLKDSRDGKTYTVAKLYTYNTLAENFHCWMTKNLDLAGGTTITPSNSNVTSNYTLPASARDKNAFSTNTIEYVYNSNSTNCSSENGCYSYYSFAAATATTGVGLSSGEAPSDICPKGWRLPTKNEYSRLLDIKNDLYGMKTLFQVVYNGYITNNKLSDYGTKAYYHSSTAVNTTNSYFLYASSTIFNTAYNTNRQGNGIRCVDKK